MAVARWQHVASRLLADAFVMDPPHRQTENAATHVDMESLPGTANYQIHGRPETKPSTR